MADFTRRVVRTERVEYVLRSPTNQGEIWKMISCARNDLGPERADWDDSITVEAREDEIVCWYETEPQA